MSLSKTAPDGDRLKTLEVLRDLLAREIDGCDSLRDFAALTGRFQSVLAEIDALKPKEEAGDAIDEIAKRRDARRSSSSANQGRAKRSG